MPENDSAPHGGFVQLSCIRLRPKLTLPLPRIINVAVRVGLGQPIEEGPEFVLVLFRGLLNRDAHPHSARSVLDRVRHLVEPANTPVNQNGAVGLEHRKIATRRVHFGYGRRNALVFPFPDCQLFLMKTTPTDYKHVELDENGVARIEETPYKVRILADQWTSWDLTPEELCEQLGGLSLSQIYSALAYYLDHKEEMDAEIERRARKADELREESADQDLMRRLRKAKRQQEESEV